MEAAEAESDSRLRRFAVAAGEAEPLYRVGLEPAHEIAISSAKPFKIVDAESGDPVWRERYDEPIHIIAQGGPGKDVPSVFRVQVGAFGAADAAQKELERLERLVDTRGVVRHDPDRGNWRVRLGEAPDRLGLSPVMERLRQAGIRGIWIAEEPAKAVSGVELRIVDSSFESELVGSGRLVVLPSRGARISVKGRPYRGIVELRLSPFGSVRPVNWIGLENYLLGVVPAELGPEVWPRVEALKAQAVAARTYAWRNRSQFADEGFDLCATPRCQVYKGFAAEHPLSNRAVRETRAEILTWNREPVVALYTATCGGHTERGAEIFPEHDEPYLEGVPCRAEGDALASLRATVTGRTMSPITDETGSDLTRDWALLEVAEIIDPKRVSAADAASPVDGVTLRAWTVSLANLAGLTAPAGRPPAVSTLGEAVTALVRDLGWEERGRVLLSDADLPALLRDPETLRLPIEQRRALAYLASVEGVRPLADGRFHPGVPASYARLVPAFVRAGETYEIFGLRKATVSGVGTGRIRMLQGKGEVALPLAPSPFLFGRSGGKQIPAEQLEIWPGDRVGFRTNAAGEIDFLELMPPVKGTSDDRTSRVYSWEVRKTRRELEAAINRRVSVGRLEDLQIVRRGVSGRIVELKVVGSKATTIVRGFDVRRLLDTRESLVVLEVQRDSRGRIDAVVFAGKGWGHGVGLCQVGAYGMALRGSSYRQILAHYYSGTELEKVVPDPK